ncbi:MAG: VOC family protein, partial [Fidelibacterota bacterium]
MIKKIDHIAIAVFSLDKSFSNYMNTLGFEYRGREVITRQGVKIDLFSCGGVKIEVMEPLGA